MPNLYTRLRTVINTAGLSSEKLGEDVIFTPDAAAPAVFRTVRGIVKREQVDDYGNVLSQDVTIRVDNDATTGITSAEIDAGTATLTVAMIVGETPEARNVRKILRANAVSMTLAVM